MSAEWEACNHYWHLCYEDRLRCHKCGAYSALVKIAQPQPEPKPPRKSKSRALDRPRKTWKRHNKPGRNMEVYLDRRERGMTYRAIGEKHGISFERVRQIIFSEERRQIRKQESYRKRLIKTRPFDLGGPRDVWVDWELEDAEVPLPVALRAGA